MDSVRAFQLQHLSKRFSGRIFILEVVVNVLVSLCVALFEDTVVVERSVDRCRIADSDFGAELITSCRSSDIVVLKVKVVPRCIHLPRFVLLQNVE